VVALVMTLILPRRQQDAQDEEPQMVLHLLADWTHDVTGVADVHSFGRFVPPLSAQCRLTVHQQPKARLFAMD
jgi:hypothetical protein